MLNWFAFGLACQSSVKRTGGEAGWLLVAGCAPCPMLTACFYFLSGCGCMCVFRGVCVWMCVASWHVGTLKSKQFAAQHRVVNYRRRILFY